MEIPKVSGRKIEGSVALVTGANRGIGRAITDALLERGAKKVYATARDPKTLEALKQRYGSRVVPLRLDVTRADQVAEIARQAPDVDLLFNNAGVFEARELTSEATVDQARREMEVNYFGPLRMLQSFADTLAQRGGAIVNIGSAAGLTNIPFIPTYSASKAALHSLTQAARAVGGSGRGRVWRLRGARRHRHDQGLSAREDLAPGRREGRPRRRRGGQ
ncbi:MAG: SDR family NAD(P)-dependent oxidoreductase [Blastocatellia bacterium]